MEPSTSGWTAWWDRPTAQLCRNASPTQGCSWSFMTKLECHTEPHPETGLPVKRCVKLHKRLLNCPGRPPVSDEQQQEVTAYGDAAPGLDMAMRLDGLPSTSARGSPLDDTPPSPSGRVQTQDVGQAFAEFLRFAEELNQSMGKGGGGLVGGGSGVYGGPYGSAPYGSAPYGGGDGGDALGGLLRGATPGASPPTPGSELDLQGAPAPLGRPYSPEEHPEPEGLLAKLFRRRPGRLGGDAPLPSWQDYAGECTDV